MSIKGETKIARCCHQENFPDVADETLPLVNLLAGCGWLDVAVFLLLPEVLGSTWPMASLFAGSGWLDVASGRYICWIWLARCGQWQFIFWMWMAIFCVI